MSNIWSYFPFFSGVSAVFWILAVFFVYAKSHKTGHILAVGSMLTGIVVMSVFIVSLWVFLERPPLRTLGETRLWYSFFLPLVGIVTYLRWHYKWFLGYSVFLALFFLTVNLLHPETYSKALMPALQSPWFVPHVIVYIFAYALLASSSLVAFKGIYELYYRRFDQKKLDLADNLVYIGFSFLTFGLLFGALWPKKHGGTTGHGTRRKRGLF